MPDPDINTEPIVQNSILDEVLNVLRRISEVLVHAENHRSAMQQIVTIIANTLGADDCSIFVYNPKENTLSLAASHGLNPAAVGSAICSTSEGIIGHAFQTQQTLNVANHQHHPRYKCVEGIGEESFNSHLAVPLSFGDRNLGILSLQSKSYTLFPPETVDMVRSLSPQVANLILNADLFEHTLSIQQEPISTVSGKRTKKLKGIIVSPGVSHGAGYLIKTADSFINIQHEETTDPEAELQLLSRAMTLTKQETLQLEQCAISLLTEADASIFATHLLMLDDHLLNDRLRNSIRNGRLTAISAVKEAFYFFEEKFKQLPDQIFRERIIDLKDIMLRLAENIERLLSSGETQEALLYNDMHGRQLILIARELLPSELMRIPIDSIRGIVCEQGGNTSHAAILAKALDIPALMAVKGLLDAVHENDELILDGHAGVLHIAPDEELINDYADILTASQSALRVEQTSATAGPAGAATSDGHAVTLRANLSLLNEASSVVRAQAQGIGLYRSEFMFMMRETLPSEQEQYNIFTKLVQSSAGESVTIRILDIGADKPVPCIPMPKEENPALGVRAIRMLMQRHDILIPHLRAILRAGSVGPVRILLPMIATFSEILALKKVIDDVKSKLRSQNIPHGDCDVGVMMETPSLLFELNYVMNEIDFLSVGTNDLLQYLFAADRGNSALAYLTNPLTPTFIHVLKEIVVICKNHGIRASICGELAGHYYAAPILVGLGYDELSMSPKRIPLIRDVISRFSLAECAEAAQYASHYSVHTNITEYMKAMFARRDVSTGTVTLPRMTAVRHDS